MYIEIFLKLAWPPWLPLAPFPPEYKFWLRPWTVLFHFMNITHSLLNFHEKIFAYPVLTSQSMIIGENHKLPYRVYSRYIWRVCLRTSMLITSKYDVCNWRRKLMNGVRKAKFANRIKAQRIRITYNTVHVHILWNFVRILIWTNSLKTYYAYEYCVKRDVNSDRKAVPHSRNNREVIIAKCNEIMK